MVVLAGDVELLEVLAAGGAALNTKLEGGWRAIHYAAAGNKPKIIDVLVKHGDEVVCEIDHIGRICNVVQAMPAKL